MGGTIERDDAEVDAMLSDLKRDGRIKVRNEQRTFWIVQRRWRDILYYYGPSLDGDTPSEPPRLMNEWQIWNWLARLERA